MFVRVIRAVGRFISVFEHKWQKHKELAMKLDQDIFEYNTGLGSSYRIGTNVIFTLTNSSLVINPSLFRSKSWN